VFSGRRIPSSQLQFNAATRNRTPSHLLSSHHEEERDECQATIGSSLEGRQHLNESTHCRKEETMATKQPNILILWGDDIGTWNISHFSRGMMGYTTPNIDRVAKEGVTFTDYYGQQSCTAGRAAFICGQNPLRTGLTKVGMPGATPKTPTELTSPLRR
jgi:hypothetical protein